MRKKKGADNPEEALIAAEISKDQFKIISIKGTGKHAEKERRG